jgi:hypothetical protein
VNLRDDLNLDYLQTRMECRVSPFQESMMGFDKVEDWSQWCFLGFAPLHADTIDALDPGLVQSLLSLVQAEKVIGSVSPLDPRHLINHKGVTAWQALLVLALTKTKEGLQAVSEGNGLIIIPDSFLRPNYSSHVNWPEPVLSRYRLEPRGSHPFVLPFALHKSAARLQPLQTALRTPDGALEIWGVVEFNELEPVRLLWEIQRLAEHIDAERERSEAPGQDG